jgi:hypothetical protein
MGGYFSQYPNKFVNFYGKFENDLYIFLIIKYFLLMEDVAQCRINGAADTLNGPSHVIGWGRTSNVSTRIRPKA